MPSSRLGCPLSLKSVLRVLIVELQNRLEFDCGGIFGCLRSVCRLALALCFARC